MKEKPIPHKNNILIKKKNYEENYFLIIFDLF